MEFSLSVQNHNWSSFVAPLTLTSSIGHKKFCVTWSSIEVLKQDKRVIGEKFYETAPVAKSYNIIALKMVVRIFKIQANI